ncbi:MAG: hypothetical protein AAFP88_01840 [Bacteroidota bacterium]
MQSASNTIGLSVASGEGPNVTATSAQQVSTVEGILASIIDQDSSAKAETEGTDQKKGKKKRRKKKKSQRATSKKLPNRAQLLKYLPAAMEILNYLKFLDGMYTKDEVKEATFSGLIKTAAKTLAKLGVKLDEQLYLKRDTSDATPVSRRLKGILSDSGIRHRKEIETIRHNTERFIHSKISVDEYLQALLRMRRKNYFLRRNRLIKSAFWPPIRAVICPTDPLLAQLYMDSPDFTGENRLYNELNRTFLVKKYNLMNFIIKRLCSTLSQRELSAKTKMFLRGAVQLQSVVEAKPMHVSHPDEGTLFGQIKLLLDPYIKKRPPATWDNEYRAKIVTEMLKSNIDGCNMLMVEKARELGVKNAVIVLLIAKMILGKNLKKEYQKMVDNLQRNQEAYIPLETFETLFSVSSKPPNAKKTSEEATWKDILPQWPGFDKLFAQGHGEEDEKAVQATQPPEQASSLARQERSAASVDQETTSVPLPGARQQAPHAVPPQISATVPQHRGQVSDTKRTGVAGDVTADFPKNWCLPHGLRMFHEYIFKNAYPAGSFPLKERQQQIVDSVFDRAKRNKVTYAAIKRVIEAVGAHIRISGGSTHGEIIAPNGCTIPGGIFYHGDNTTYGHNIEFIQAQLLYLGLRPAVSRK